MEIVKLNGEDRQLYALVAHLIMNEEVLRYNLNYPYRTSETHKWFIAVDKENTLGFIPVKLKEGKAVINNYYVEDDDKTVFSLLLQEVIKDLQPDFEIESVTQTQHVPFFEKNGFSILFFWTRYVKMIVLRDARKRL